MNERLPFMKRITCGMLILFAASFCVAETEAELRQRVEDYYKGYAKTLADEDMDAAFTFYSKDFSFVFAGPSLNLIKKQMDGLFKGFDDIRAEYDLQSNERIGDTIHVRMHAVVKGRAAGGEGDSQSELKTLEEQSFLEILIEEDGRLKSRTAAVVDDDGYKNMQGQTYKNQITGCSFTAPEDWIVIPTNFPKMLEAVLLLAPDLSSACFYGYLEIPYQAGAKEAYEGDDDVTRRLAKDSYYEFEQGPMTVAGYEAYGGLSKFIIPEDDRDRQRRRVYLTAGGLMHVLMFDAIPSANWPKVEPGFQSILDSFSLDDEKTKDAAQRARAEHATGEIVEGIYTNEKAGCQIAAPEGWTLESSNLGSGDIFTVIMHPPNSKSLARVMAWDFTHPATMDQLLDGQIKGLEAIAKDVVSEPSATIQVGSFEGRSAVQTFTLDGLGTCKRRTVLFVANDVLYLFLCDAIPPEEYNTLEPGFDEIVNSFTIN